MTTFVSWSSKPFNDAFGILFLIHEETFENCSYKPEIYSIYMYCTKTVLHISKTKKMVLVLLYSTYKPIHTVYSTLVLNILYSTGMYFLPSCIALVPTV